MIETVQLFGTVHRVGNPQIESGTFRFAPASIQLNGRTWITLTDVASGRANKTSLLETPNASWFRGRLQTLFEFQQPSDKLDRESWIDGKTYADRMMLNSTFVGETNQSETLIQIPFVCTEQFGDAAIYYGRLPERNSDRNVQLMSTMSNAFVDLLLASDNIDDYHDYAITFGRRFEFGVRDGVPYNTFLKSHR